jgi:hypothetical protein
MRTILLVQTLIIIAGAYYVYTLTHPTAVTPVEAPAPVVRVEAPKVTPHDSTPQATTTGVTTTTTTTVKTNIGGPHDAGMEWPTLDGIQSQ